MSIRKIIAPIRGDGKGEGVLDHALALGRRFNAHIEAVHARPRLEDMMPFGVVAPSFLREQIAQSTEGLADAEEARLRQELQDYARGQGVDILEAGAPPPQDRVTLSWYEAQGKQAEIIGYRGRLGDLTAVARPDVDRNLGMNTLQAALIHSGRPVLMCPPAPAPERIGAHIAVAWNGAAEAARAVSMATWLLDKAHRITILTVGGGKPRASPEELTAYFHMRGHEANCVRLESRTNIGAALLDGAQEAGADVLLMGAYGQGRERETLLGGATQHVVDHAQTPVIMAR